LLALGIPGLTKAGAATLVNLGLSAALSAVAGALNRPSGADLSRELSAPRTLPVYRHAYGRARIQGSPAPAWEPYFDPTNRVLYACILLNSRESAGGVVRMFLDRRAVGLSGDLYDFGEVEEGSATVLEGNTQVTVSHTLGSTPVAAGIQAWSDAGGYHTIDQITSTTFRVTIPSAAGVGGETINWMAMLSTDGAAATNSPFQGYLNAWLGLGGQAHPPTRILQEWGDFGGFNPGKFWPSDKWAGRTVLWLRIAEGPTNTLTDRWPAWPPAVEVEADWSKVWDSRDGAQSASDPTTWTYSDNQALCLLDALRQNPLERYPLSQIRQADFEDAADVADEGVSLKSGGTERRYRVGGLVAYANGPELLDQLQPLALSGAGELVRIGGKIGYRPGVWVAPEITLDDALRDRPMTFRSTRSPRDLPGAVRASFPDPASSWELTGLQPITVDPDWDGAEDRIRDVQLGLVPYARQAMRIQQIIGRELPLQKELSALFPPSAIEVVAGCNVTVDFPRAGDVRSGVYRVVGADPAQWLQQDDRVSFSLPLDLLETAESVFAWNPETDEQDFYNPGEIPPDPNIPDPLDLAGSVSGTVLTVEIDPPGTLITDPNPIWEPDLNAPDMEWEFRRNDDGFWQGGGTVSNVAQTVSDTLDPVATGESYDIRVRSVNGARFSAWIYDYAVQVGFTMAAPNTVTATAGSGQVALSATSPNDSDFASIQFWASDADDFEAATLLSEQTGAQNTVFTHTDSGLLSGQTRYYFVRALTSGRATSEYATANATAT